MESFFSIGPLTGFTNQSPSVNMSAPVGPLQSDTQHEEGYLINEWSRCRSLNLKKSSLLEVQQNKAIVSSGESLFWKHMLLWALM